MISRIADALHPQHYTVFYDAVLQLNKGVACQDAKKGDRATISTIARFEKSELG